MEINKLSFRTEEIDIDADYGICREQYLAFFFMIDGKPFSKDGYHPANAYDVVDEEASEDNIVIILHCSCGYWQCSSLVARVSETSDGIIEWTVDMLNYEDDPHTYRFKKGEYEKTMSEVRKAAEQEIELLNAKREDKESD